MLQNILPAPYFLPIKGIAEARVFLKLESLNPTGSIKYKTAISLLEDAEKRGLVSNGARIIESSSGNLGIALAATCAKKGYHFTCVVDPNISPQSVRIIESYGGEIVCVDKKDINGGYLGTRIEYIKNFVKDNPQVYWTNQYANKANPNAHFRYTAREIAENFPSLDHLVIGAGTTGTLMGCIAYFGSEVKVLAVDSVGSITFGDEPAARHIPGLGTSKRPIIFDRNLVNDHVLVPEVEAVLFCRWLARSHGYLAGGSTGSILAGLYRKRKMLNVDDVVVAISPDGGEKYLDTLYCNEWIQEKFGSAFFELEKEFNREFCRND